MEHGPALPPALELLHTKRPRNLGWLGAGALLFGDWGTSRLYVLGIAFLVAGRSSFYLIAAMSLLILAVGWAYTQICRIFPDGGGVYTAARQRSKILGVVGALLLFADYTITASLSAVEAFHYFGLGAEHAAIVDTHDAGDEIILHSNDAEASQSTEHAAADHPAEAKESAGDGRLLQWNSPGLWAIITILGIGGFNLLGPKHSAGFAVLAAIGMIIITLLVTAFALPQIKWSELRVGSLSHPPMAMWEGFVGIVLALSGVEAIASLTGVMKKPVYQTASKAIWVVALEVAIFNLLLGVVMVSVPILSRSAHQNDMLAFLAKFYVGAWGEWPVRIIGGVLLLSATNTAIGALTGTLYVMSRDSELPTFLQKLNSWGAPWIGTLVASIVPAFVLILFHDLETLSHLYAIGIVGAVAINCCLCVFHPRLRKNWRKIAMAALGALLLGIWFTLAVTKPHALIFVAVVMVVGLSARQLTRYHASRRPKPSLLRQAIVEQLTPEALARPRVMLSTAGSAQLADAALREAKTRGASLVVCFIRQIALSYKVEGDTRFTLDTDPAAQALFVAFLGKAHGYGVPIIPMYDTGPDSTELIAEHAAMNGVEKIFLGSSRRGTLHQLIKGNFQKKLEALLPEEIPVQVLTIEEEKLVAV